MKTDGPMSIRFWLNQAVVLVVAVAESRVVWSRCGPPSRRPPPPGGREGVEVL